MDIQENLSAEQFCIWFLGMCDILSVEGIVDEDDEYFNVVYNSLKSTVDNITIGKPTPDPSPYDVVTFKPTAGTGGDIANSDPDLKKFEESFDKLEVEDLPETVEIQSFEVNHDDVDIPNDLKELLKQGKSTENLQFD